MDMLLTLGLEMCVKVTMVEKRGKNFLGRGIAVQRPTGTRSMT